MTIIFLFLPIETSSPSTSVSPERLSLDHCAIPVGIVDEAAEAIVRLPLAMDRGFVH